MEQTHAENEFMLRAYVRSSKRAKLSEVPDPFAKEGEAALPTSG